MNGFYAKLDKFSFIDNFVLCYHKINDLDEYLLAWKDLLSHRQTNNSKVSVLIAISNDNNII
jgi:hypothetical protein